MVYCGNKDTQAHNPMADPRHLRRIKIVQNMFALLFQPESKELPNEHDELVDEILKNQPKIDEQIAKNAPRYPLERIAKIDLCILRLAIYELNFEQSQPTKVIIDEAVTLAREFGGERSYAFINAVLGAVYKDTTSTITPHE